MSSTPLPCEPSRQSPEAEAIASAAPFNELPTPIIEALAEASDLRRYAAGETIFAMGQYDGSEFLVVQAGRIKVSHADPNSGAMLFEDVPAGEIFGLATAASGGDAARLAGLSLTAERDSLVVAVDAAALRELARERPTFARCLMLHFARRLSGDPRAAAEESSPERRIYATLSGLIERDAVSGEWRIRKMPKHRELADRADVDETAAANAVARLIQSGIARRDYPGLVIDDIDELNRLAR